MYITLPPMIVSSGEMGGFQSCASLGPCKLTLAHALTLMAVALQVLQSSTTSSRTQQVHHRSTCGCRAAAPSPQQQQVNDGPSNMLVIACQGCSRPGLQAFGICAAIGHVCQVHQLPWTGANIHQPSAMSDVCGVLSGSRVWHVGEDIGIGSKMT